MIGKMDAAIRDNKTAESATHPTVERTLPRTNNSKITGAPNKKQPDPAAKIL